MQTVKVDLGSRSYDIILGVDILKELGTLTKPLNLGSKVFVVTDPLVKKLYGAKVETALKEAGYNTKIITVPQGEKSKNLTMANKLYLAMVKFKLQRDDTVLALGGGVVGDLAGFVAATYMRGINFVQIPTTLLAGVDSSVGGKTGVDLPVGKNLVGAFYQPRLVLIDLETLGTLASKEVVNGLAEVIKYGVIKSASLFDDLEKNKKVLSVQGAKNIAKDYSVCEIWQSIIAECCSIKAEVVKTDERESRYRMILNFGHTIGHAIEALTKYTKYSHGEAISIGMVAAANLAVKMKFLEAKQSKRIKTLIETLGLPSRLDQPLSKEKLIALMELDKKVRGQKVQFVLPKTIGEVAIFNDIELSLLNPILEGVGCK